MRGNSWCGNSWCVLLAWSGLSLACAQDRAAAPATAAAPAAPAADEKGVAEVQAAAAVLATAFDAGKADEVAGCFLPDGELIDEEGTVHQGREEIRTLLTAFFTKYPGAKATFEVESIRPVGPLAIEEGIRTTVVKGGGAESRVRYVAVWAKTAEGRKLASMRDYADDPPPSPHELLQPLAWLEGEWINEGEGTRVQVTYRWSEDKNFLLGEFHVLRDGKSALKSSQRIGWDPLAGKVRSWLFDSDGSFSEASWTRLEDAWVLKSAATLADGRTGSATVTLTPSGPNRFAMKGTERIVGDERLDDFEIVVARRPPQAGE